MPRGRRREAAGRRAERFELRAGAFVCFPAGQELGHYIENDGNEPFRYLIVGERIEDDRVVYPPE